MIFNLDDNERKKLLSLLDQHEKNIDYLLYLQPFLWQNPVFLKEGIKGEDPFQERDFLFNELEKAHPFPNDFIKKNIKWDSKLLRVEDYLKNPYLKALKDLSFNKDGWSLSYKTLKAFSLFPYEEEYHYGSNYSLKMNLAYFNKDYVYPSISLFDREWMSLNPYEIRTMENAIITSRGKVLTLGLGLGYYAYMVHLKKEVKEVHIVEMDLELIKIFNEYLLPLFPYPEKIHIHKADAFHFINNVKDKDYDFIFNDLWHDVGDGLASYLKLKQYFKSFRYTQCQYWIESSIITYLRLLVIGVIKDEYFNFESDYDDIQKAIKEKLKNHVVSNSYDLDDLLNIKGLNRLIFG